MRTTHCSFVVVAALALVTTGMELSAAVKVDTAEPIETVVAFRVAANRYIGTSPSNALEIATGSIGSKQTFTIIDLTGGNLQDGDEVRVRYTPHHGKPSFWLENATGVRRGHDGDVFKLKRLATKFALVTPTGKFVAAPTSTIALGVSDKLDGALLVEIIDFRTRLSVIQPPEEPSAASPTPPAPAPTSPATPAPATDKPATQ